jgi:hypothetical protein
MNVTPFHWVDGLVMPGMGSTAASDSPAFVPVSGFSAVPVPEKV